MLEGVALPFESVIEQEKSERETKTGDAVFYASFPECAVSFLAEYYKNTMEQSGWILQKEFNTHNSLLLSFFSVSRICLICICKNSRKLPYTKKVMICIGEKNA